MLKRRGYDILTITFIVLGILFVLVWGRLLFSQLVKNSLDITEVTFYVVVFRIFPLILGVAYWLIILSLAIKLHKKDFIKTVDLILLIVLIPLAWIFYFSSLRGALKKYEKEKNSYKSQRLSGH